MDTPYFEWREDDGSLQRFDLPASPFVVGRHPSSDLVLNHVSVSNRHARVYRDDSGYVVEDLGSTNGTMLNGRAVTRQRLTLGDQISFAGLSVIYKIPGQNPIEDTWEKESPVQLTDLSTLLPQAVANESDLDKISLLLDLQVQAEKELSPESILLRVLENTLRISGAERGFVFLSEEGSSQFAVGLDANMHPLKEASAQASQTVVERVASTGEGVFLTENLTDDLLGEASIVALNLRAVACLPLKRSTTQPANAILGVLYLDSTKAMHALSGLDEKILTKLSIEAANVVEKMEMLVEVEEKRFLEKELTIAHETQVALLPESATPRWKGSTSARSAGPPAMSEATSTISSRSMTKLVGILADVSGKGVAASLLSSSIQGCLQVLLRRGESLDAALTQVNSYMCERTESSRFATIFMFAMQPDGDGSFLCAGHNPAYLFRSATGEVEFLHSGHLIVGAFDHAQYEPHPLRLARGDVLLVYSDGLTEATNLEGEEFGEDRLRDLFVQVARGGAAEVQHALLAAVDGFTAGCEPFDDLTFIVLQRSP